jgi:hypothetical protein
MSYNPDFEVNVDNLDDADLLRFVADTCRPTPAEHSVVSARMYDMATRINLQNTAERRAVKRAKLTLIDGGKDVG